MKMNLITIAVFGVFLTGACMSAESNQRFQRRSTTIEKERPELNEETKQLIAAYRKAPSQSNYNALRRQVEANYDRVIARKKAKLEEVRKTAKHQSLIDDMETIVNEVVQERERRIEQSMRRFTDPRLRPGVRENRDGFLTVIGSESNISIAYTPVTNEEYAVFVKETKRKTPIHWKNGVYAMVLAQHPVVNVSYADARDYCRWFSQKEGVTYRLPTVEEWEYAAGHMPKDADFNCGVAQTTTPVQYYASTLSACGAVDMWGNCWEWTSTSSPDGKYVKGGSFQSSRTSCRTENRNSSRRVKQVYDDVGFRIVRINND